MSLKEENGMGKEVKVIQIDAFTKAKDKGNPAGVITDGDNYTTEEMQQITAKIGFNECVFICKSEVADVKLRYFTPGYETPLCGHATVAASYFLSREVKEDKVYKIETLAGILEIAYNAKTDSIYMEHARPESVAFCGDKEKLCESIGITVEDLDSELPIRYGSTGSWTMLVPVKEESVLDKMKSQNVMFPEILTEMPKSSIHPFCILDKDNYLFSARHFSSPYSNTIEDSVTGTASGVIGAYALEYIYPKEDKIELVVHQGKHVQREGIVKVFAERAENGAYIKIAGQAVYNKEMEIVL